MGLCNKVIHMDMEQIPGGLLIDWMGRARNLKSKIKNKIDWTKLAAL